MRRSERIELRSAKPSAVVVSPSAPVDGTATQHIKPCTGGFLKSHVGETRRSYGLRIAAGLVREGRQRGGKSTWIYFIQERVFDGAIKVGIASNPVSRLCSLQTGNPNKLEIRSLFFAPAGLERVIHEAFADHRLEGEWFASVEALETLADALHEFTVRDPKASGALWETEWGLPFWLRSREVAA